MPRRVGRQHGHRNKKAPSLGIAYYPALVARPAGKVEIASTPDAAQAMDHALNCLRNKKVWDESNLRDWADVIQAATTGGFDVHFGHIGAVCVESNSKNDVPYRKYKGRVVFLGNVVVDQSHD